MTRLPKTAMTPGAAPVRTCEASSAKVTSRRWCSASMAQCPPSTSARRAGRANSNRRLVTASTVTVCHRLVCSSRRFAGDLDDLGGVRQPEVADRDRFEAAVLDAAVATVTGAVGDRDAVPGQAGAAVQQ